MPVGEQFDQLVAIMQRLRGTDGCPWDREQTHRSLRPYLLEEAYEVLECIDEDRAGELSTELGDLLLQVLFHAQIASEARQFSIADVIRAISEKMVRRHPHVFGEMQVASAQEQTHLWERLKKLEGTASVLEGVPRTSGALQRAMRLQQKASAASKLRWRRQPELGQKLNEELTEFSRARANGDQRQLEAAVGTLLFAVVQMASDAGVSAEDALRGTCEKFIRRFRQMEHHLEQLGKTVHEATQDEVEEAWAIAKPEG